MENNAVAFRAELEALCAKYDVVVDIIPERAKVIFYTDGGRFCAGSLQYDDVLEIMQPVKLKLLGAV
jgi:hypothetical protein